ncbi:S-adenosyl-L-methionine-dependent methyltransferase [Aspergillus terricola var. indicus]
MQKALDFDNFRSAQVLFTQASTALLRPNPRLEYALSNSAAHGLPPITINPLVGQHLSILAQVMGARSILEVGTLGGYSSIHFAETGAKVTSVEINPQHRDVALENLKGLDVEVLLGAAATVLPKLAEEGRKFDLVFIDADLADKWEQFDMAVKVTRPNGCIFVDDVVATMFGNGDVGEDKKDTILTKIGQDDRVRATLVPVVACHPIMPTPLFNGYIFATVKSA